MGFAPGPFRFNAQKSYLAKFSEEKEAEKPDEEELKEDGEIRAPEASTDTSINANKASYASYVPKLTSNL